MRRALLIVALAILAGCSGPGLGGYLAATAAVVNGDKIPESAVATELRIVTAFSQQNREAFQGAEGRANRIDASREILGNLIRQQVIYQEARSRGIKVKDGDVEAQARQVAENSGPELRQARFTPHQLRSRLRDSLLVEAVTRSVTDHVKVSKQEVLRMYRSRKSQFDRQRHLAWIVVCDQQTGVGGSCRVTDRDHSRARELARRARAGEDFAQLARQFSVDTRTKERGGDLGWLSPGQLQSVQLGAIERATFGEHAAGSITRPLVTPLGVHIVKVVDIGRPRAQALEELEPQLLAPKREQAFQQWLAKALQDATIRIDPRFGRFDDASFRIVPLPANAASG